MMDRPGNLDGSPSPITLGCEYIRVPKSAFTAAITKLKVQETQLVATRNLHRLMQEKDAALNAAKEQNRLLRATCEEKEARLASRLQSRGMTGVSDSRRKPTSLLEPDSAVVINDDSTNNRFHEDHDVEADGCSASEHVESGDYVNPPAMRTKTDFRKFSPTVHSSEFAAKSSIPSTTPSTTPSLTAPSAQASLNSGLFGAESRDLFDKLSQQNARLKKAIRDILAHKGLTVSDYLDKQEYEDAADMLRQDYRQSQAQVERLKAIIKSRDASELDKLAVRCAQLEETLVQSERRYTVLKAYADAVRQAHDNLVKEKKENASSKPSPSPTTSVSSLSAVSASDYAKVVESLQKLKTESQTNGETCKRLTEEKERLLKELNGARQEIESLKQKSANSDKLQHDVDQLLEENNVLKSQIAIFQDDFTIERKERMEQKRHLEQKQMTELAEQRKQFESTLAKHQDWVRRLSEEARVCRVSWESERTRREELERKYVPRSTSSCHVEAEKPSGINTRPTYETEIAEDGPSQQSAASAAPYTPSTGTDQGHVCPRCERTFASSESTKFQQHLKRCRDD